MKTEVKFRSEMTVKLVDSMASDDAVVKAARVSSGSIGTEESNTGLINYLMRERHGSPFEHNAFTFYVEAPIFVFREFQRHRIASYNEESGRYKQLEPVFYVPPTHRNLVQVGKPGHYEFFPGSKNQQEVTEERIEMNSQLAYAHYEAMLNLGVAREVARMVLSVNIYSSMYVTMNARSLMNFLSLRSSEQGMFPSYPQAEIAWVAEGMENWFKHKMPVTWQAYIKNKRVAP